MASRILVVDDQRTNAEMVSGLLRNLGYEVEVALDVVETLQVPGVRQRIQIHDLAAWPLDEQVPDEIGADEAGSSGDQVSHVRRISRRTGLCASAATRLAAR